MARKTVRAVKNGFWEGHRRRAGSLFTVEAKAKEHWFVDVGPAGADDVPPEQLLTGQAPPPKTFVGAMVEIARKEQEAVANASKPLAAAEVLPTEDGSDLT